jgi:hypothetical protein
MSIALRQSLASMHVEPPHPQARIGAPTHGYEATREAAMAAFAKSWRRE